jgi:hypothetical protein
MIGPWAGPMGTMMHSVGYVEDEDDELSDE